LPKIRADLNNKPFKKISNQLKIKEKSMKIAKLNIYGI
jgi:hypothetical protein